MLARLILPIACLMAYSPTVRAGQIIFNCEVAITAIGHSPHHVVIDADHGVVRDNTTTTANGVKTPGADNLEEWVQVDNGVVAWGNRHFGHGPLTSKFELNLQTGEYTITSAANGQIGHGSCRGLAMTS